MKKSIICAALLCMAVIPVSAQQQQAGEQAPQAVTAYASGDNSYLAFSGNTYQAGKKYIVFKVWKDEVPLPEREKTDLAQLKESLAKKGVDLVMVPWKTEADLKTVFARHNLAVTVTDGQHIRLQNGRSQLNTTAARALYIVENGKPVSLCSGSNCEERARYFFGLKALN